MSNTDKPNSAKANPEKWTIGKLLEWTASYLKQHGADSPRLDAEVLLAHARNCRRIELYTSFEEEPAEAIRNSFRELVKKRAAGQPVAHLVGAREFYSLAFKVTPDVLVPRPESELLIVRLVELAAKRERTAGQTLHVADVGAGSGALAVCAAKNVPDCRVTAIDISPAALAIAKENAERHGVTERIEFIESDLFAALPAERRFDFILSNPPYVSTSEMGALPRDVRDFEPRLALEAGPRGTEIIERLAAQAADRLEPQGWLLIEISPQLAGRVEQIVASEPRLVWQGTANDLSRRPRVAQATIARSPDAR